MFTTEKFSTTCTDGVILKGILLIPDKPKAVIQFNCGTATKKEFYLHFLEYFAENGYICALWDYRGSGETGPKNLKGCTYKFHDYGVQDMSAVKEYLRQRFADKPFFILGHSAGGQLVGFMKNLDDISGMVNVSVSTGYIPYMPLAYRIRTAYFFFIFTPLSILLTGYLKAKKFGYMEDLPATVVTEWQGWCLKKDYFFNQKFYGKTVPNGNFKNYTFPVHVFSTIDDPISTPKNVAEYWSHIKSTEEITHTLLHPADLHVKTLGHFGFFKKHQKPTLWLLALQVFDEYLLKKH